MQLGTWLKYSVNTLDFQFWFARSLMSTLIVSCRNHELPQHCLLDAVCENKPDMRVYDRQRPEALLQSQKALLNTRSRM